MNWLRKFRIEFKKEYNRLNLGTAKKIRKECDEDIKRLQGVCKHSKSTWGDEYWAIGHGTGRSLKVCDTCEKTLEIKDPLGVMQWKIERTIDERKDNK